MYRIRLLTDPWNAVPYLLQPSPYYEGAGYPALDREDLFLGYGWILSAAGGTEWVIGMVEDRAPSGPAIDAVF